ncbi:hypothetical protein APHAL10511_000169 [Amanita phalloides]|nr:hypothetical protein APHAL10511_000169 [Amanita phalloides]
MPPSLVGIGLGQVLTMSHTRDVTSALNVTFASCRRTMSKLITKVPHGEGHTSLAFSKDGKCAFTGGQDCVVLIWKLDEGDDQEPERAAQAEDAITSLAATHDCWLAGSKDSIVRQYSRDSGTYEGDLADMKGIPIRDVAIDPRGKRVVVSSDDVVAKVIDVEDSMRVCELKGHQRGIRRATWHPSLPLITTCGSDGKIIAWDVSADEPKIEATMEGVIPALADIESPDIDHDCSAMWHPSGQYFYVATRTHEIAVISRSSWSKTSTLSSKESTGTIAALALSPNGQYLVSAIKSRVYIWSTETKRIVASHNSQGGDITQIAFSPRDNLVAWSDKQGGFTRWPKPVPDSLPGPVQPAISNQTSHQAQPRDVAEAFYETMTPNDDFLDNDGIDFDVNMDDADDGLDDPNFVVDDLGIGVRDEPESAAPGRYVKEMVSITKAQPAFQPGSTPATNRKRYLAYNLIGVIEATQQDEHQVINVEFFDRSTRKNFHFTSHSMYDLGYLGERGALFACQQDGQPAHVCFKPFAQWPSKEWTYELRPGTRILGIAVGGLAPSTSLRQSEDSDLQGYGNIVIATSESDLTFLSGTGRERRMMGLGAELVTMVAGCECVFIVHREGSTTIDGSQNLSYSLINFEDFSVRQHGILPIPKNHLLKWAGLTDQGAPVIYDSTGRIHVLTKYRIPHHAAWTRVMDTTFLERRVGKDENYWPVGVTRSTFFCLILKGRQEHPGFPRPLIQELPLQMPFRCKEPKEESFERELLFVHLDYDALDEELTTDAIVAKERTLDKELIQLIQIACKDPADITRALELTKLLHNVTSIDSAIKIAEFYHLVGLKEKMQIIKTDREEREDRLVLARNKRKRWLKPEPLPREIHLVNSRPSRTDPFAEQYPIPSIERPGMARVTIPVIESSQYTKTDNTGSSHLRTLRDTPDPATLPDAKRKRDKEDESREDYAVPPPKQKTNPFAKRIDQDASRPFVRKTDGNKVISKSESFFERIESASTDTSKLKRASITKEKKKGHQTTLLGVIKKGQKPTTMSQNTELDVMESQVTDVITSDGLSSDMPSGWSSQNIDCEETQSGTDTQLTEVETS